MAKDEIVLKLEENNAASAYLSSHSGSTAQVKGKYAFIPTSSDLFAKRKAEEVGLEK